MNQKTNPGQKKKMRKRVNRKLSQLKCSLLNPSCNLHHAHDELMYLFHLESFKIEEVQMPTFEYVCKDCGKEFLIFLSIKEYEANPKIKCPHCDSDHVARKLSGFFAITSRKS